MFVSTSGQFLVQHHITNRFISSTQFPQATIKIHNIIFSIPNIKKKKDDNTFEQVFKAYMGSSVFLFYSTLYPIKVIQIGVRVNIFCKHVHSVWKIRSYATIPHILKYFVQLLPEN